jgi:hypothetical protein
MCLRWRTPTSGFCTHSSTNSCLNTWKSVQSCAFATPAKIQGASAKTNRFQQKRALYKSVAIRAFYFALACVLVKPNAFIREFNFAQMSSLADPLNFEF